MIKESDEIAVQPEPLRARIAQLRDANLKISEILDCGKLFQEIADQACALTQAQYGALLTFDGSGDTGEFVVSGMSPAQANLIKNTPRGRGILASLDGEVKPVRKTGHRQPPRVRGLSRTPPGYDVLPGRALHYQGRLQANLYLADKVTAPEFTPDDEVIISAFAAQAAVAMNNAIKHDQPSAPRRTWRP